MDLGFAYHHSDRHLVSISPDIVIILQISGIQYRHPVLDDSYRITVEFRCGTGC